MLPHPDPLVRRLLDHADTWDTSVRSSVTAVSDISVTYRPPVPRLLNERLSLADTEEIVKAFRTGTRRQQLAEEYGISVSSVKRVLARHGVKKPRGYPHST